MIVALTAAAALTPSKDALIGRWLRADRTHIAARLASVPVHALPPPDLRILVQRELAVEGRYQLAGSRSTPTAEPWWLRVWDWVHLRWQRFWNALFARVHVGSGEAASVGDVMLVLVGILMTVVVVRLLRNLQIARSELSPRSEPLEEPPAPRALYKRACNAAARSDYGGATLLLFAAMVALLDRRGAVAGTPSATVGDLRRELRGRNAALIVLFDAVAAPFIRKAYAERLVDEPQWHRARDAFAMLLQEGSQP